MTSPGLAQGWISKLEVEPNWQISRGTMKRKEKRSIKQLKLKRWVHHAQALPRLSRSETETAEDASRWVH